VVFVPHIKLGYKLNESIVHKIVGIKKVEFSMHSQLFYTQTVHRKSSGELNTNVTDYTEAGLQLCTAYELARILAFCIFYGHIDIVVNMSISLALGYLDENNYKPYWKVGENRI